MHGAGRVKEIYYVGCWRCDVSTCFRHYNPFKVEFSDENYLEMSVKSNVEKGYTPFKVEFSDENYLEMSVKSNVEKGYTNAAIGVCLVLSRSMKKLFQGRHF